jgi:hypothetical protein
MAFLNRKIFYFISLSLAILYLISCDNLTFNSETKKENAFCRWVNSDILRRPCGSKTLEDLKGWQSSRQPLDAGYLNIYVRGNPMEIAQEIVDHGFLAPGREDLPRWPLKLPIDWNADPFDDRNWQFHVHAWRMLDPLIMAWKETGDTHFINRALAIVKDWHDYHFNKNKNSKFGWYDMSTGIRAMKLAFLLDHGLRGEYELNENMGLILLELADAHAVKLQEPEFLSRGNHGWFQIHGLMALCKNLPFLKSCHEAIDYAESAMEDLLKRQFSAEGVHLEDAPEYHFFVADTVQRMVRSGWYDSFESINDLIEKLIYNKIWMVHPDKRDVTVGDSEGKRRNINFPEGNKVCKKPEQYQPDCYHLKTFPETGYAVVRSDWAMPEKDSSMLFFMASFHSTAHKLSDDLSIELFEFGERILTNSGKYSYSEDPFRDFVRSSRAHNTVEINNRSFSLKAGDAYGSALDRVDKINGIFYLEGEVAHDGLKTKHRRRLIYSPRRWLLVLDRFEAKNADSFTQWFHFAPQIEVSGPILSGGENGTNYIAQLGNNKTITVEQIFPSCDSKLIKGRQDPVQGWSTAAYGKMVPRYSLGFFCSGREKSIGALFLFDPESRENAMTIISDLQE